MNALASKLGLSEDLAFYDVYSLTDPDLISLIPRPLYALLVILPLTPVWNESRIREDAQKEEYAGFGPHGTTSPCVKAQSENYNRTPHIVYRRLTICRASHLVQANNRTRLRFHWPPTLRHQRPGEIPHPP
jgi:hypothetical protein